MSRVDSTRLIFALAGSDGGDGWIRTNDLALMKRPLCL